MTTSKRFRIRPPRGANEDALWAEPLGGNTARILSIPFSNKVVYGDVVTVVSDERGRPKVGRIVKRPYPFKATVKFTHKSDEVAIRSLLSQRDWPIETSVAASGRPGFLTIGYPANADIAKVLAQVLVDHPKAQFAIVPFDLDGMDEDEDEEE